MGKDVVYSIISKYGVDEKQLKKYGVNDGD